MRNSHTDTYCVIPPPFDYRQKYREPEADADAAFMENAHPPGCSLMAFVNIGRRFGYTLTEVLLEDAVMVRDDQINLENWFDADAGTVDYSVPGTVGSNKNWEELFARERKALLSSSDYVVLGQQESSTTSAAPYSKSPLDGRIAVHPHLFCDYGPTFGKSRRGCAQDLNVHGQYVNGFFCHPLTKWLPRPQEDMFDWAYLYDNSKSYRYRGDLLEQAFAARRARLKQNTAEREYHVSWPGKFVGGQGT